MNYITKENYITRTDIQELVGNDCLTHKENFVVQYKNKTENIFYCHKKPDKRNSCDFEPYSVFFNEFININERFIVPGKIAIDIGAYDGDTTLPISFLAGCGKTFAFECSPSFVSQLNINLGFNPQFNIESYPFAIMPEAGIHQFLYCATDDNGGHPSTNSWVGTYTVPRLIRAVNFIDFFKDKIDFNDISFIKVDTEGHDFHILWSFRDILKSVRPVLHAEWFPHTDRYIKQLIDYLDYEMFCGFTLKHIKLDVSDWRQDIVLVPREKIESFNLSIELNKI
jgi:FkbM family methyltransferase